MGTQPDVSETDVARRRQRLGNAVGLFVFALALIGVTFVVLDRMVTVHVEQVEAVVSWKAQESAWDLAQFMDERSNDALVTSLQQGLPQRVVEYRDGDAQAGALIQNRLAVESTHNDYEIVAIFSGDGEPLIWAGTDMRSREVPVESIVAVVETGEPRFVESARTDVSWPVWWLYPMTSPGGETFVLGERVDLASIMLDIIARHENSFEDGEIVILDPDSNGDVRSICSADGIRVTDRDSCTGMRGSALGETDDDSPEIVRAVDCKTGNAFGAVVEVEGTDWRVLAKTPESIAMQPVRESHRVALGVDLMLFAIAGLTVVSLQRGRERRVDQARSLEEVRQALASQDRFLANMSHELRTPLNSIMGFTSLMLSGMTGPMTDEQHKQLGMVDESSKRLLALVNDVLDLSKLKAGKHPIAARDFTVAEIVADACGLMHPLSQRKDLECGFTLPDEDIPMHSDRDMVERVVLNLLSNAIKFTDEGFVSLGVVLDAGRDEVRFTVHDSGRGISAAELARVMEEFTQIVEPAGVKPVGTGLGLAISRRMAEALGGTLLAESEPGVGSTFTFVVPRVYSGDGEADV